MLNVLLQNYTEYVGKKSSFRLLNRGSAKALDKVVELDGIDIFPLVVYLLCFLNSKSMLNIWILQKQGRRS